MSVARGRWIAGAAIATFVVAVAMWFAARQRQVMPAPQSVAPNTSSALSALDLPAVNQRALSLARALHFVESVPYFRREIELLGPSAWQARCDLGRVLNDATYETRNLRSVSVPATRSTIERVAMMREALAAFDRAEAAAPTPGDVAGVMVQRTRPLWAWGLRWETVVEYRRAFGRTPTPEIAQRIREHEAALANPVLPAKGGPEAEP